VIEKRCGPIDKACGKGGFIYHGGPRCARAVFRAGAGRGVHKTALHGALLDAIAAAGVKAVQRDVGEVSQDAMSVRCGVCGAFDHYFDAAPSRSSMTKRMSVTASSAAGTQIACNPHARVVNTPAIAPAANAPVTPA
jgi:hypothetical protein